MNALLKFLQKNPILGGAGAGAGVMGGAAALDPNLSASDALILALAGAAIGGSGGLGYKAARHSENVIKETSRPSAFDDYLSTVIKRKSKKAGGKNLIPDYQVIDI